MMSCIGRKRVAVVVLMAIAVVVYELLRLQGLLISHAVIFAALASVLSAWLVIRQWFKLPPPSAGLTRLRASQQWYLEVVRCCECKRDFQAFQLSSAQYKKLVRDGVCRCRECVALTNATVHSPRSTTSARHRYRERYCFLLTPPSARRARDRTEDRVRISSRVLECDRFECEFDSRVVQAAAEPLRPESSTSTMAGSFEVLLFAHTAFCSPRTRSRALALLLVSLKR